MVLLPAKTMTTHREFVESLNLLPKYRSKNS